MRVENVMVSVKNVEMWEKKNEGCVDFGRKREEYLKGSFGKLKVSGGLREDLELLMCLRRRLEGMRFYVVSDFRRELVLKMLEGNGLSVDDVCGDVEKVMGEWGVEKEDVVVFGNEEDVRKCEEMGVKGVVGVEEMWKEIGLRRG